MKSHNMQFKSDKSVKPVCGLSRCYAHTPPENRSVHSVSMELGVGEMTIHRWITQVKDGTINFEQDEENPSGQRNMTEKLNLLLEYQKIPQDQNGEWLRQNGLHEEHLNLFQQEIKSLMANKVDDKDKEIKELKKQLAKKDKELKRKDAALAELAAIMALKKKLGWMDDDSEKDV